MAIGMGQRTSCFLLASAIQKSLKVFDPRLLMIFLCFFENFLFNVCYEINLVDIGCVYGTRLQELSFVLPSLGTQISQALFPDGIRLGCASTPFSQTLDFKERKHACRGAKACSNRYPTGQGKEEYKLYVNISTIKSELKHKHYVGTYILTLSADGVCA